MANCEGDRGLSDRSPLLPLRGDGPRQHLSFVRRPGPEDLHFIRPNQPSSQTLEVVGSIGAAAASLESAEGGGAGSSLSGNFDAERIIGPESFQPVAVFVSPALKGASF